MLKLIMCTGFNVEFVRSFQGRIVVVVYTVKH